MKYRPEIDGLRTVAVLSVILFHAGFGSVSGGFVGVDVFFVISGFLITSIILNDLKTGQFSFRTFYERRARRILPALLFVSLVCIPFAWAWMLPDQFRVFSGSLFANAALLSNFYFMTQIEYFQPAADLQPLVHTWSLSIEEQYYLLFPLLLVLLWKLGWKMTFGVLALLVLGGIYLAHIGITDDPAKNYFHSGARLWEIGAGSLCAMLGVRSERRGNPLLAGLGLALIGSAVFLFSEGTPFPSLYTLVPVAGTMLVVLFADADQGVGRFLGHRVMVGLGLLSYSAYLWHQPLFAFARLRSFDPIGVALSIGLVVLSFVLAYFSWRFIENPFRKGPRKLIPSRPLFMSLSLGAAAAIAAVGLYGYLQDGFPDRQFNGVSLTAIDQRLAINAGLSLECTSGAIGVASCETSESVDVVLWGDSYAMHLVPGLLAANPDLKFTQLTLSGCAPILDLVFSPQSLGFEYANTCLAFNQAVLAQLQDMDDLQTVLLSSEFGLSEKQLWQADGTPIAPDLAAARLEQGLADTIAMLTSMGLRVVVFSPPPESGYDIGQCLSKIMRFGAADTRCDFDRDLITNGEIYEILDRLDETVSVVRLDEAICPEGICDASREGVFIYRDKGHLSIEGSAYLGRNVPGFNILQRR